MRVDVQSAIALLAPAWGLQPLLDIDDDTARENLAHVSVMALSFVAQSARGIGKPMVPQSHIDEANTIVERMMRRWRGEPDPKHVQAVDAYFVSAAEHGMNASTFTARVIASTGADVAASISGAVGAMSGPLHGGAPSRVLGMIEEIERTGDADAYVRGVLDRIRTRVQQDSGGRINVHIIGFAKIIGDVTAGARHVSQNDVGMARNIFRNDLGDGLRIGRQRARAFAGADVDADGLAAIEILDRIGEGGSGGEDRQRAEEAPQRVPSPRARGEGLVG